MITTNGSNIYMHVKYIKENMGKEVLDDILNDMKPEYAIVLKRPILSAESYDILILQDFLAVIEKKFGRNTLRDLGHHAVSIQLKGVFGFLMKFISIEKIAQKAPDMWNKMYSEGRIEVKREGDNIIKVIIDDFKVNDALMLGILYWMEGLVSMVMNKKTFSKAKRLSHSKFEYTITSL